MGMSNSGMGGMGNNMSGNFGGSNQSGGGMYGGMGGNNSAGGRRGDSIMVRNLALDCNWHTLKDRFSHAGDIKYAEMKDRGIGVIRTTLKSTKKLEDLLHGSIAAKEDP